MSLCSFPLVGQDRHSPRSRPGQRGLEGRGRLALLVAIMLQCVVSTSSKVVFGFELNAFPLNYEPYIGDVHVPLQFVLFITKFESWKYEREWRVLVPLRKGIREGNLYFFPMSDAVLLREVILGPLCTLPFGRVRELVNKHHTDVVTIKSRMADKYFSIVPDENTVPPYPEIK